MLILSQKYLNYLRTQKKLIYHYFNSMRELKNNIRKRTLMPRFQKLNRNKNIALKIQTARIDLHNLR